MKPKHFSTLPPSYNHMKLLEGSRDLNGNKIIISESIQKAANLDIGDIIDLSSVTPEFNPVNIKVGGVISDKSIIGNNPGFLFILTDIRNIITAIPPNLREQLLSLKIDIAVDNFLKVRNTAEEIEDRVGLNYLVFVEKDVSEVQVAGIRAYQTAMNLVIIASFVVEFLFIANILGISIRDRQKEIGTLRAVGTKSWQIIELVAIELLIYAIIGGFLGLFVGFGFSMVLVGLMDEFYTSIDFHLLSLNPSSIFAVFFFGIIVALISGLYPIFLAKATPVVQNIHLPRKEFFDIKSGFVWKYTIGTGVILTIIAIFLLSFVSPSRFLDFSILSLNFFTVLLIFLGTILIEIGILMFLPRVAMKALFWFDIVTRTISTRNIAREFRKSLFTIMTSAMALTFIIIVGSVSASIIAEVPNYYQDQWQGIDVIAENPDDSLLPLNLTLTLDSKGAIEKSAFIQESRTKINSMNGYIFGVDPEQYRYFAETVMQKKTDLSSYKILNSSSTIKTNGLVSHLLFQRLNVPLGENVSVTITENRTIDVTLAAVVKANIFLGNGEYIYICSDKFQSFFNITLAKWFICKQSKYASTAKSSVARTLPKAKVTDISYYTIVIENTLTFQTAIFQVLFIEAFILSAIAQFVCILVSTLRMEREMGIMRSLGLSKKGVFSIFMLESIILGSSALIVGILDGLLGSILLVWYISLSLPINLYFSPERIIFWIIVSFLITLASTIVPSYRSSQKNVIATIYGRPMKKDYVEKTKEAFLPYENAFLERPIMENYFEKKNVNSLYYENSINPSRNSSHEDKPEHITRRPTESTNSLKISWYFIKTNKGKLGIIFCIILAIAAFNYVLNPHISLRGLILFDHFLPNQELLFLLLAELGNLNLVLFFVGLACISPIGYYLSNHKVNVNLIKKAFQSLILGFILIVLFFISLMFFGTFFMIFINGFLSTFINQTDYYYRDPMEEYYNLLSYMILGIELLFFQRVWALLVLRGLNPKASIRKQISWIRKNGSKGQVEFIGLVFIHVIIRTALNIIFGYSATELSEYYQFYGQFVTPTLDPITFLVIMSFEISFFILLIIYQLIQFEKAEVSVQDF